MMYDILYRPVFSARNKKLTGYDMCVRPHDPDHKSSPLETLVVDPRNSEEFDRFQHMLSSVLDPFTGSGLSFVDKHPLEILRYLRGEKEPAKKTMDWEKDIDRWSVNLRGERVE